VNALRGNIAWGLVSCSYGNADSKGHWRLILEQVGSTEVSLQYSPLNGNDCDCDHGRGAGVGYGSGSQMEVVPPGFVGFEGAVVGYCSSWQ